MRGRESEWGGKGGGFLNEYFGLGFELNYFLAQFNEQMNIFKTNRPLLVEAEEGLSNGQIFQVVFVCLLTWLFNRLPLKVEHLRS